MCTAVKNEGMRGKATLVDARVFSLKSDLLEPCHAQNARFSLHAKCISDSSSLILDGIGEIPKIVVMQSQDVSSFHNNTILNWCDKFTPIVDLS